MAALEEGMGTTQASENLDSWCLVGYSQGIAESDRLKPLSTMCT